LKPTGKKGKRRGERGGWLRSPPREKEDLTRYSTQSRRLNPGKEKSKNLNINKGGWYTLKQKEKTA